MSSLSLADAPVPRDKWRFAPPRDASGRPSVREVVREVALITTGFLIYLAVRVLTEGSAAKALANADAIIDFERRVGMFWEPTLQGHALGGPLLTVANWVYIWGHWPVIVGSLVWLLFHRPRTYYVVRNGLFISGAIGLLLFAWFPLAPPRLTNLNFVDSVHLSSQAAKVLQPTQFVNQYAAMPSLHFGWDLLLAIALFRELRPRALRVVAACMPIAMGLAIVVTANHYIVDALVGGTVAVVALALGSSVTSWHGRRTSAAPATTVAAPA